MFLYMGSVSFDVVPLINHRPAPGSVYRSPQLYAKLRHEMDSDNSSADAVCVPFLILNLMIFLDVGVIQFDELVRMINVCDLLSWVFFFF